MLKQKLADFIAGFPKQQIAQQIAEDTSRAPNDAAAMLDTYLNETLVSLALVEPLLAHEQRILEVGAGLCLFSLFLKGEGYDIVALEPATGGFGEFERTRQIILEQFPQTTIELITTPAEMLDANQHGRFDLIFSNNVIEHIPQWQDALSAMQGVLSEKGYMIHNCPNYTFPYEPHYGVPVFRCCPSVSRKLFDKKIGEQPEVWDSLNFISHGDVRRFCREKSLQVSFEKSLLYKALNRIGSDPLFRERHGNGLIGKIYNLLTFTGIIRLIRHLPPAWTTPMIFTIRG